MLKQILFPYTEILNSFAKNLSVEIKRVHYNKSVVLKKIFWSTSSLNAREGTLGFMAAFCLFSARSTELRVGSCIFAEVID